MADLEKQAREILRSHRGDGTGCYGLYSEDQVVAAMLAFRAAQPVEESSCTCLVAFGQDEECPAHGIGTAWRADNPEADMRASPAALTTPPAGRPEKEARPDREAVAQIVARAYGGSLYPGIGVSGDYPVEEVDYRAADAILALFPTDDGSREERMREALELSNAFIEETHPGQVALIKRNRAALSGDEA